MSDSTKLIAITGGIGSGKSIVSHILRNMGYDVYDCDSRAKQIMGENTQIKKHIFAEIACDAISFVENERDWESAEINRAALSDIVFASQDKLNTLNGIVHEAVRHDIKRWYEEATQKDKRIIFVETAILYSSRLDCLVDNIWYVKSPLELRISRVMSRDNTPPQKILERMNCQQIEEQMLEKAIRTKRCRLINNDTNIPILPQITQLLKGND